MEPVSEGKVPKNLPLMEATFKDPFIKGVAPKNYQDKFIVSYPDYEYKAGGKSYLVTHGHYLDDSQTLFESLEELVEKENGNKSKAIKNFFKRTAEYQAVANAISFMQDQRDFVDDVFTILGRVKGFLGHWRDKRIDEEMKTAIILYLTYYRDKTLATLPDHFIFGHTHQVSQSSTKHFDFDGKDRQLKRLLEICNDGSFMETKTIAGTFVLNDSKNYANPVQLYKVNKKTGKVTKTN